MLSVLLEGARTARANMARDLDLLDAYLLGGGRPLLRLYRWERPSITLGKRQQPDDVLDLDQCRLRGVEWAARPTGGKAVIHLGELTYGLICGRADGVPEGLLASHAWIAQGLRRALELLGVRDDPVMPPAGLPLSVACFASPTPADIMVGGRKLLGGAQLMSGRALLQQGSLTLTRAGEELLPCLRLSEEDRQTLHVELRARSTTLTEALGHDVTWEDAAAAVAQGLQGLFRG